VTLFSRVDEEEAFKARAAQLRQQRPHIELEYSALPGAYPEVIRAHAAAGTLSDAVYLSNLLFEGLALAGTLQPIDALLKRDRIDLRQWYESGIKVFVLDVKQTGWVIRPGGEPGE
jgi:hypothetical protein